MMFDETGSGARRRPLEAEGVGNARWHASHAGKIAGARADGASRSMAQDEPGFAQEMRPRIARDGEQIDLARLDAAKLETGSQRLLGKPGVVLDPPVALFFDCGDQLSVANQDC